MNVKDGKTGTACMGISSLRCLASELLYSIYAACLILSAQPSLANPNGGQVVAGDVAISRNGSRMDVVQRTEKGIVDWRGFSIDAGEHTNFNQPSSSSVTLNRVRGSDLSHIDGNLTANGRIFLINPNGVLFGSNSRVSVGGLVATTSDLPNDKFLAGRYNFDQPSANPNASVVNQGEIQVHDGGAVVLAAPRVRNEGSIHARLGRVELAGTETFTVDFDGDGLLSFQLGEPVKRTPEAAEGETTALVTNKGEIFADGGIVTLSAHAADAVIDQAINMEGVVQAQTVEQQGGVIILSGGDEGIVSVSGSLDASGPNPGQSGGTVKVLGEKVGLFADAKVDVSGHTGGGEVLIGGNFQGKGPEPNAARTYVDAKAEIKADAMTEGNGGEVIVWADEATRFRGDISARGGAQGGDGGYVEVSGKQQLEFLGSAAVDAPQGQDGKVLLDPLNIVIDDTGTDDAVLEANNGDIAFDQDPGATLVFSDEALESITGNIVLQATDNIEIRNNVQLTLNNQTEGESVVFQAGNDILLGQFLGVDVGITLSTNGADVIFEADSPSLLLNDGLGLLQLAQGVSLDTAGGSVTMIAADFGVSGAVVMTGTGDINIAPTFSPITMSAEVWGDSLGYLNNMHTDGSVILGQATTAGAQLITATDVFSDLSLQSIAQTTVMLA